MALHEKKQDRHEAFFQRQLDRKEYKTDQLRVELNKTQQKLKDMVRGTREAERQLRVDQVDVEHQKSLLSKTMGRQVAKMSHLWNTIRAVNVWKKKMIISVVILVGVEIWSKKTIFQHRFK